MLSSLRLQRYIFGILLKNFLLILVVVTAVGFMGVVGQNLGKYAEVSLGQLLGRFPFLLPSSLVISMPLDEDMREVLNANVGIRLRF